MKRIFYVVLFFMCTSVLMAQQVQVQSSDVDQIIEDNILNFQHLFMGDIVDSNDIIHTNYKDGNFSYSLQFGTNNKIMVSQEGVNLFSEVIQFNLIGKGNEANLWSVGKNTISSVVQLGTGNVVNSFIENVENESKLVLARQLGRNNEINVALLNDNNPLRAAEIRQFGQGNKLSLVSDYDWQYSGISVTQRSGWNGQGMTVNLYQSAFSFPMVSNH